MHTTDDVNTLANVIIRFCYKRRRKGGKKKKRNKVGTAGAEANLTESAENEYTYASIFRDRSQIKKGKGQKRWKVHEDDVVEDPPAAGEGVGSRQGAEGLTSARKRRGARPRGTLYCPNEHCRTRIGRWDWDGLECSCGEHVQPGFAVSCRRVKARERPLTAKSR